MKLTWVVDEVDAVPDRLYDATGESWRREPVDPEPLDYSGDLADDVIHHLPVIRAWSGAGDVIAFEKALEFRCQAPDVAREANWHGTPPPVRPLLEFGLSDRPP